MTVRKAAFGLGAMLILIGPAMTYFFTRSTSVATLALVVPIAFVIVCKLDDIAEFSIGPLRARMRETIEAANATIEQLREVATVTTRVILTDLIASNFMNGMAQRTRFDMHDAIVKSLRDLGVSEAQIKAAETEW